MVYFKSFTFEPLLSLDDRRNLILILGKIENGNSKAIFCIWSCLSFRATSGYNYALVLCNFSIGCGFPVAFQVLWKVFTFGISPRVIGIWQTNDFNAVRVFRGLRKVELFLKQTIVNRHQISVVLIYSLVKFY